MDNNPGNDYSLHDDNIHITLTNFAIKPDRNRIFRLIDCSPESPVYDMVEEEYEDIIQEVYSRIQSVAILQLSSLDNRITVEEESREATAFYVFMTIGMEVSKLSTQYFEEGNYLAGMLANAIADDCLSQLDNEVGERIAALCRQRHIGVARRLEVPSDIPMEAQKIILEVTGADRELGMGVTEGYMFTAVKSNCFILIISKDEDIMKVKHDCRNCTQESCRMRSC